VILLGCKVKAALEALPGVTRVRVRSMLNESVVYHSWNTSYVSNTSNATNITQSFASNQ
jgi:hypothetical protein